jgi:hypothetical protein
MKNVYEIFAEFENAPNVEEKIAVLRNNDNWALKNVLIGTFSKNVRFSVKEIPAYKPDMVPPGMGYTSIHQELGRVYLFEEGNPRTPPALTEQRKKELLVQTLEALEPKEAEVYANMLLKRQNVKGLTYAVVREAFPDLPI